LPAKRNYHRHPFGRSVVNPPHPHPARRRHPQRTCRPTDGTPWRDHDWRDWRSRVWQPACEAIGIATITKTTIVSNGKRKTKRTYAGPVPYDLRHSFASLLIHDGKHSIVQISEWMGHSPATLLSHYAHVIADLASKPSSPNENAIKVARRTRRLYVQRSQIVPQGNSVITYWY
jgi:integrase